MRLEPKQSCVDCHFYVIKFRGHPEKHLPIEKPERDKARQKEYSWIDSRGDTRPGCYFEVWSKEYNESSREEYHQFIVEKNRRDFCFWFEHHPTMRPEAAEILQEREAKNRDSARDRRLTSIGLWIAAIALVANAVLKLVELFC